METGIKQLDRYVSRLGITQDPVNNQLQKGFRIYANDPRLRSLMLPYCMHRLCLELRGSESLILHTFYLPYRPSRTRLASFLLDEQGNIIEQVYFQRQFRYINASKAIAREMRQEQMVAA